MFRLQDAPLPTPAGLLPADDPACGGLVAFEGRVRNHDQGRAVTGLHYEAYEALALSEGQRILDEARVRFAPARVAAAHRCGTLEVGEVAVVVVAAAPHRQEAFLACRWIIDQIKERLPIWKRELFTDGTSAWVACGCHHQEPGP